MNTITSNIQMIFGFMTGVTLICGLVAWVVLEKSRVSVLQERKTIYVRGIGPELDVSDIRADVRRRQVNQKLKALSEKQKFSRSRLGSVKAKLVQAGLDMQISRWWIICIVLGFVSSVAWNRFGSQTLLTPVVFVMFTFVLPNFWLSRRIQKRQLMFTKHFASAIDIMVRGLKSGMPLQESVRTVSTEIPAPVGPEFRIIVDQVNAGLSLPAALERAYERLPTQELRFFATIIAVQEQNGGNLSEILGKISDVLRGRAMLKEKAKALSGEARMSAIIVGALPFLVASVLFFANREYISLLWTNRIGNYFLAGAVTMMATGMFIMNKMGELDA